jgi:ubiquinone/menaquinone biosynthesis C-methylase UbiE
VSFTDTCPDLAEFNLVVAIDVLEHLPNLKEVLIEWGKVMKPGTEIYHVDMFENHPTDHPMHFDYKEEIDKWFEEAGFKREALRLAVKV